MSTPAEAMTQAPPGGGESSPPAPAAASTMTPQKPKGEQASADAGVQVAIRMLERALAAHGDTDPKGSAILKSLTTLHKAFGHDDQGTEIMPAEVKTALMAPAGEPGGGPQTPAGSAGAQPPAAMAA